MNRNVRCKMLARLRAITLLACALPLLSADSATAQLVCQKTTKKATKFSIRAACKPAEIVALDLRGTSEGLEARVAEVEAQTQSLDNRVMLVEDDVTLIGGSFRPDLPATGVLVYSGPFEDVPFASTVLWKTVGEFTKRYDDTAIKLTWSGFVDAAGLCQFQLRVDDSPAAPPPTPFDVAVASTAIPVSATAVFTGLTAGTHTVSIWSHLAGPPAGSCGGFSGINASPAQVVVEELPAS